MEEEETKLQVLEEPEVAEEGELSQVILEADVGLDEGERLFLGPRVDPQVLKEGQMAPDWTSIDRLAAWTHLLRRWERVESEEERDRAHTWLVFLPQVLLRQPKKGGTQGRREVAKRFLCVMEGDWGSLVVMWRRMPSTSGG